MTTCSNGVKFIQIIAVESVSNCVRVSINHMYSRGMSITVIAWYSRGVRDQHTINLNINIIIHFLLLCGSFQCQCYNFLLSHWCQKKYFHMNDCVTSLQNECWSAISDKYLDTLNLNEKKARHNLINSLDRWWINDKLNQKLMIAKWLNVPSLNFFFKGFLSVD